MIREPRQEERQQGFGNGGQRAECFEIAHASAIACRAQPFDPGNLLIRDEDVAQFSAEAFAPRDHFAFRNNSAAKAGTDNRGN